MNKIIGLIVLLLSLPAHAQWKCAPNPIEAFYDWKTGAGFVYSGWCAQPRAPGTAASAPTLWSAPQLIVPFRCLDWAKWRAAEDRIMQAADKLAQINIEIAAPTCPAPAAGSYDEWVLRKLYWLGCEKTRLNPPAGVTFTPPLPADWCGADPGDPPAVTPPAEVWKATGGTIFLYNATTNQFVNATVRKAAAGAACDPTPPRKVVGGTNYMQLVGGNASERTACAKQ